MEECTTIYMCEELREAIERSLRDDHQAAGSDTGFALCAPRSGHLEQLRCKSLGVRRSFGSTDLLHSAPSLTQLAHSSVSLDYLEGALPLRSVTKRVGRMEHQPSRATEICLDGRKFSLDNVALPGGGEGKSSDGKIDVCAEEYEKWEDARESGAQIEEDVSGSVDDDDNEEEEEEETEEENGIGTRAQTDSVNYMQFHSLPQSLVPSEITHCLFELEKEWIGVERERKSVMWKMEMIHSSVQTVQGILRRLLTHLVEAQSFDANNTKTSQFAYLTSLTPNTHVTFSPAQTHSVPQPHISGYPTMTQTHAHTYTYPQPHSHCQAAHTVARKPSEMCLTHPAHPQPRPCCSGMFEPPSCAQRRKEKMETFHILTELRESVGKVCLAQEQDSKEQREILALLHGFQQQIESLLAQQQSAAQLDHHCQQTSKINMLALCQQCQAEITEIKGRGVEEQKD
ncbi:hypothetical protein SRHO_G00026470 [Serrasalmus rhombeus]